MSFAEQLNGLKTRLAQASGGEMEVLIAKAYLRLFPGKRYRIYRMLARLLDADIDSRTALDFIYDVVSNDGHNPNELDAIAVRHWVASHREHGRLSEAITGWVPASEVLLIEAGESSGQFQHALEVLLRLNDRLETIRGQIIGQLAYPVGCALMLCGVIYFLSVKFIPPLLAIRGPGATWTGTAASAVSFLTWSQHSLIPTVFGVFALGAAIFFSMPYLRGPLRNILDKAPPWTVYRFMSGTGFLTSILVLMEGGRGLVEALSLTRPHAPPYLATKITNIQRHMREGSDFGSALIAAGDHFPDRELIKEIQIYDRIGRLHEGLLVIVERWMADSTTRVNQQIGLLGNLVLFGSFSLLGFVFNGLYDIINQLKQG